MKVYFIINKFMYAGYKLSTREEAETKCSELRAIDPKSKYSIDEVVAPDDDDKTYFHYMFAKNGWADNVCVKCGYTYNDDVHIDLDWRYCPYCGRKVVKRFAAKPEEVEE